MAFDFAALKAQARRTVHDTLAVSAQYTDSYTPTPIGLRVRWHSKIDRFGNLDNTGYSELIEGVNRVIFDRAELDLMGIHLRRGGRVELIAPGFEGTLLILDSEEPGGGPVTVTWNVAAT